MEEHDAVILDNILSTVGKRDVLWLLGDCFFDRTTLTNLDAICERVQAVNFIPGNHDTDKTERQEILRDIIKQDKVNKFGSMMTASGFWLTHPPIHPRELWGKVNIHGHVHWKTVPDANYINVSCENVRYKPVNIQDLKNPELCERLLVHYGDYTHDCKDHLNGRQSACLVCDKEWITLC